MIEAAGRVLAPGGELWTVFNRHLQYLPALERHVGPTVVEDQTPTSPAPRSRRGGPGAGGPAATGRHTQCRLGTESGSSRENTAAPPCAQVCACPHP